MKNEKLLGALGAVATTTFVLPFVFRLLSGAGPYIAGAVIYSLTFLFGAVSGRLFGSSTSVVSGVTAFITASILCVPVVLVTYGFALLGSPLVIVYGVIYGFASKKFGRKGVILK